MKQVGFKVIGNPEIHDDHDFEVWVECPENCEVEKEPLYFEMRIEDGRVNLYWWDFTHTTFLCHIDRTTMAIRDGMQKLYCGELTPVAA
jgi:hypothetical protein